MFVASGKRDARIRLGKSATRLNSDADVSTVANRPSQIIIKSLAEIKSEKEKRTKVDESNETVDSAVVQTQKSMARKRRSIELYRPKATAASNNKEGNFRT
jgi:hypothetical protein